MKWFQAIRDIKRIALLDYSIKMRLELPSWTEAQKKRHLEEVAERQALSAKWL